MKVTGKQKFGGKFMPQAIGDPDELDRFAQSLTQFIDTLNEAVNGLNHSFGAPWRYLAG